MAESAEGTVLVVDDNEANRYVLTRLLRRAGYHVLEGACGKECLAKLAMGPDLVILDVNLPDIKGTELARRIKQSPDTRSVMVLNMSASFTRTQDRIEGLDMGADGYLTQPVDPPEFIATVRSLMRIRRAEAEVRRANQELEQFAYVASHDLQEPLRTIGSFLELLETRSADALDESSRRYLRHALEGAGRMSALVRDLLGFAQVERAPMHAELMDCALPLGDALDNLKLRISEGEARIVCGSLPALKVDRSLMAQVFQNLITNAIKFRGPEAPLVRIVATREGGRHVISVSDNGIGIPPGERERIFGIFQRLHGSSRYPGSGIGLSQCKRIIERHSGTIGVESAEGEGSRFWFALPAPE